MADSFYATQLCDMNADGFVDLCGLRRGLVRIWTGDVAIEVDGSTRDMIQAGAEALMPFGNVPVPGPPGDLPPPNLEQCPPSAWLPSP